jgi:hypothetical protein
MMVPGFISFIRVYASMNDIANLDRPEGDRLEEDPALVHHRQSAGFSLPIPKCLRVT